MKKFLDQAATFILDNCYENNLRTAVIFPNRRTGVFLKNHLKQQVESDFWLPEFYTTDEFMLRASGLQKPDPVLMYFDLFKIHREIAGADARSIEDFLVWAPVILSDFNDIDLYLADAETVFSHLSETKAMEAWNPDGRQLTEMQRNYLAFFQSLQTYYTKLNGLLQEKKSGYTGWIYRKLAENMEHLSNDFPWDRFVVIGLNALSKAEKKVFDFLNQNYQVDFLWDVDEYYLYPEKFNLKQMEAGRFVRQLFQDWKIKDPKWISNHLLTDSKSIRVVGVPKHIGQAKYAGQLLESLLNSEQTKASGIQELDTAVVLADEKLLVPMLNALPQQQDTGQKKPLYNVTMGYPLSNSPLRSLILQWLELLINQQLRRNDAFSVHHLTSLLQNPVVGFTLGKPEKAAQLTGALHEKNRPYLTKAEIINTLSERGDEISGKLIGLFLQTNESASGFMKSFVSFLQLAKPAFQATQYTQALLKEQFHAITQLTKTIQVILSESGELVNLKALQKILLQIIRRNEISLRGEPLSGIQIMGMLETRNLDFKNIILLSANEGNIPKASTPESFIPFDIRSQFDLPLVKEKIDVFAYHFYRLLQRAQNITLIYNCEPGELGGGEKSRFILQLKDELAATNTKIKLEESLLSITLGETSRKHEIIIAKTREIIEEIGSIAKKGLSPSALNTYIQCSLQYYFSKILKIKAPAGIDDSIESNTFGTIIHETLEQIYQPFTGKIIEPGPLKKELKKADELLSQAFSNKLNQADFRTGKNLLSFEVAKKYVTQFVESDARQLKYKPHHLLGLEQKLSARLKVKGEEVLLKGTIDRIDRDPSTGTVILADYKTGQVTKKELSLEDWHSLATDPGQSKVLQLLFYAYLFLKNNPSTQEILPGIFSFRTISAGFIPATLPEETAFNTLIPKFEKVLSEIIGEIFDPETPFTQTENTEDCQWCDFKSICMREGSSTF